MRKIGKRGQVQNKIVLWIIAIIVLALVIFFIFKFDILKYIHLFPSYGNGGNNNDKDLTNQGDETIDIPSGVDCPVKIASFQTYTGNDYIYFCNEKEVCAKDSQIKSSIIWEGKLETAKIYLPSRARGFKTLVAEVNNRKVTISSYFLVNGEETVNYYDYRYDLPKIDDIILLDGSEIIDYPNKQQFLCKSQEEYDKSLNRAKRDSNLLKIVFDSGLGDWEDIVYAKWIFGQGPALLIRPNGDKVEFSDNREQWAYSDLSPVFTYHVTNRLDKIAEENVKQIKGLFESTTPSDFSRRLKLLKNADIEGTSTNEMDIKKINEMLYDLETAPEDPSFKPATI